MAAKYSAPTTSSSSLKEYLKKYESQAEEDKKKKKKKKNSKTRPEATAVLVVDQDPVWQKPVNVAEENEDDSADEEKPQIEEDIEVKRMKRLEQLRLRRPYNAISEDGSGWIALSETSKQNPNGGNDDDADMSPPRKRTTRSDTPPSPGEELKQPSVSGREEELNPDIDMSPPRRRGRASSPELLDLSPPRQRRRRFDTPSVEPETRASRSSVSNSDMSPPRRRARPSSPELDLSPPRQRRRRFDTPSVEPETRASRSSVSNSDMSPPRQPRQSSDARRKNDMLDNLPPRPGRRSSPHLDLSPPRKSRKELSSSKEQPKTGLITGQDIKEVNAKTKKDEWLRFKEMDPAISGRGAEPVYRDKVKGERISKDEFAKSQKGEEKPKEKKLEWGKGLAQKREAEEKELELELEKDKPFARTRDDPELDKMLKERVRWGDPMAHLVKKSHSEAHLRDLGDSEKMTESGFIIPQDVPSHSWLKRGLDAAPNRYGIKPGRHWDGVDRSNGFEKGFFKRTNEKQATQREAYLWSVADM